MTSPRLLAAAASTRTESEARAARTRKAIFTLKEATKRKRHADYSHMDPADLTEEGVPYDDYSSPCIEPHPFGGGIRAGDY
jgi:hypothetical protein